MMSRVFTILCLSLGCAELVAQEAQTSVRGVTRQLYATLTRDPGGQFDWGGFRGLMAPDAVLRPQLAQSRGKDRVMSVEQFIAWIDSSWMQTIGTPRDRGFFERETHVVVEEFGDVAHAFSTYVKGPLVPRQELGRGINSIQLVRRQGVWYIAAITWDEENPTRPVPSKYRGQP